MTNEKLADFAPMTVGQLKQMLNDIDDDKPIRVWVECRNKDEALYLEGRKLAGVSDEDRYCSLCAMYYREGDPQ